MNLDSLTRLYVHELEDLYSAQADRLLSRIAGRTVNFQAMI